METVPITYTQLEIAICLRVCESQKQMNLIHASCLRGVIYSHEMQRGAQSKPTATRTCVEPTATQKIPGVPETPVSHSSTVHPPRPRLLRLCALAMPSNPWKAFSSCHKCQRLRSGKINEPALRGQMTLSKISSSSFSSCLLSLYYSLFYS